MVTVGAKGWKKFGWELVRKGEGGRVKEAVLYIFRRRGEEKSAVMEVCLPGAGYWALFGKRRESWREMGQDLRCAFCINYPFGMYQYYTSLLFVSSPRLWPFTIGSIWRHCHHRHRPSPCPGANKHSTTQQNIVHAFPPSSFSTKKS